MSSGGRVVSRLRPGRLGFVVALVVLADLGGLVLVQHADADARRAAARAYAERLRPMAAELQVTLQPIQSALELLNHPQEGDLLVVADVARGSNASAALGHAASLLKSDHPPKALAGQQAGLQTARDDLSTALDAVTAASAIDDQSTVSAVTAAEESAGTTYVTALNTWRDALGALARATGVRAFPYPTYGVAATAAAASKGSWVLGVDQGCRDFELALAPLGAPTTDAARIAEETTLSKALATASGSLSAVPLPSGPDGETLRATVVPKYATLGDLSVLAGKLSAARTAGNAALVNGLLVQYHATFAALQGLSTAFADAGAKVCSGAFDFSAATSGSGSSSAGSAGPTA